MADTRCDRTDLLVDQCACPQHRGGRTPQEEAGVEQLAARARLLGDPTSRWFAAIYPGRCAHCGHGFEPGTAIRLHKHAAGSESHWIAECCAEEADRG